MPLALKVTLICVYYLKVDEDVDLMQKVHQTSNENFLLYYEWINIYFV